MMRLFASNLRRSSGQRLVSLRLFVFLAIGFIPLSLWPAPVTFLFTGQVGNRYITSAEITYPPEIGFRAPVSGSVTFDLAKTGTQNTSGLDFLGRYELFDDAVSLQLTLNGLDWQVSALATDTPGPGADDTNRVFVRHNDPTDPDEVEFRFWDVHPAQDSFPLLEPNESARVLITATDDDPASSELSGIGVPPFVPSSWNWEGDIGYVDSEGIVIYGFKFSMDAVFVAAEPPLITRWRGLMDGDIELGYIAEPGFSFELESSPDLKFWSPVGILEPGEGEFVTTISYADGSDRYYRIKKTRK